MFSLILWFINWIQYWTQVSIAPGTPRTRILWRLVIKLKTTVGTYNSSVKCIKIISNYKNIGYNINVLQQIERLVVNPINVGNLAFLWNCTPVVAPKALWLFRLKYVSIDGMVWAWCCVCCRSHRALTVGLFLLRYSVVCTVESLSLFYLLLISWFICGRRWFMDKLGIFHANQTSMCLDLHQI